MNVRILLAEDVDGARRFYRAVLEAAGYQVVEARDGHQCLDRMLAQEFDLLITDVVMPGLDGVEVIKAARVLRPNLAVIAISGGESQFSAQAALTLSRMYGADAALLKPFPGDRLVETVERVRNARP